MAPPTVSNTHKHHYNRQSLLSNIQTSSCRHTVSENLPSKTCHFLFQRCHSSYFRPASGPIIPILPHSFYLALYCPIFLSFCPIYPIFFGNFIRMMDKPPWKSLKLCSSHGFAGPQIPTLYCNRREFFISLFSECTVDRFTDESVF